MVRKYLIDIILCFSGDNWSRENVKEFLICSIGKSWRRGRERDLFTVKLCYTRGLRDTTDEEYSSYESIAAGCLLPWSGNRNAPA